MWINSTDTFPVVADQTLSVLSSDPDTILFPENCKQVMTWSSCPFRTFTALIGLVLQFISILCCLIKAAFQDDAAFPPDLWRLLWRYSRTSSIPASRHFSLQRRLSSARNLQVWQVCAALNRSLGSRKDNTWSANWKKKQNPFIGFLLNVIDCGGVGIAE